MMAGKALRLGLLWPGGGAEQEYYQFAEALDDRVKIFLAPTRVGGGEDDDHEVEHLKQTARVDWLLEAARRLTCLKPDTIFWACTSGSFILGRDHALAQVAAIEKETGAPAGSTSLAFAGALKRLGLTRVSVLATYPEPASRAFVAFLAEHGIEVVHLQWLDAQSGWAASVMPRETVIAGARKAAVEGAQAVLVPDTAMPTLFLAEELEEAAGLPVLTANQVTLWDAMRLAGGGLRVRGFGSTFDRLDAAAAAA
jgi:maleate cis-trans isomerase